MRPKHPRFEVRKDGHLAILEYEVTGNVVSLLHTIVPEELQGKGVGSELAKTAFEWAREHDMKVHVVCSFVAKYLQRHSEYADLVVAEPAA